MEHWKWRWEEVERLADQIDFNRYCIEAIYLIGSTKNASAGPGSDIDIIVHQETNDEFLKQDLNKLFKEESIRLAKINLEKTGYYMEDGLLDVHYIDNNDIKNKTSFAVMINSITDGARLIRKK
ncbi:MAG: hypothetical protein C0594_06850 [Marinilabiliales bacterium]|nr:MAG: hypothetical protein C0594_06850 [Marinilabiliales bacterium]